MIILQLAVSEGFMGKERIHYLDNVRVFATFLIMQIHVAGTNWVVAKPDTFDWQVYNVYDSFSRCALLVFTMISGVFFLDPKKQLDTKRLYSKNLVRIITAFVFWSILYALVIHVAFPIISHEPVVPLEVVKEIICGHYHLWYLFTIAGLYLITPFVRLITADKKLTERFIVMAFILGSVMDLLKFIPVAGDIIAEAMGNMEVGFVFGYTGLYMLGYYINEYGLSKGKTVALYICAAVGLLFTITVTGVWSATTGVRHDELYGLLLPGSVFVAVAIFVFFKDHVKKEVKWLAFLSEISFGMYLVHDFFIKILLKGGISTARFNPILSVPVVAILVFVCSALVAFVMSKIPLAKKYIM